MFRHRLSPPAGLCFLTVALLCGRATAQFSQEGRRTAAGQPAEGLLKAFLGEPLLEKQVVFEGGQRVREPYMGVAVDGTVLVMQNYAKQLRRSEDGGRTWGEAFEVPFGFLDTNLIVDENSGDILSVRLWDGTDRLWRSSDHGKTWTEQPITLKPNEVMKWIERAGLKRRGTWEQQGDSGIYILHANASEAGITLRHGQHKGRLLVSATFRPHAKEHPSDRKPVDSIYSCAIYSDDGGATWQASGLFPEGTTEEAAVAELQDGRIYYNSRSCSGYYDKSLARELRPEEILRREAWSDDGGQTWENLRVSPVLSDGGGYGRGYGMKGGLVRLPVMNRDILIYSNADTAGGNRERLTVWASFDGGETWPVKRLVHESHAAYSCLDAARPGTPGEGTIYLLFEGGPDGPYTAMQFARLNLSWILAGEPTGDGEVPDWVK
ncbi:MAG: glycoside hydrolase [Pirellulaceae bacterium]|nr:glycoside hydrolase [Pirellulaceae bacterium]